MAGLPEEGAEDVHFPVLVPNKKYLEEAVRKVFACTVFQGIHLTSPLVVALFKGLSLRMTRPNNVTDVVQLNLDYPSAFGQKPASRCFGNAFCPDS